MPAVGPLIPVVSNEFPLHKALTDGSGLANRDKDRLIEHNTDEAGMWLSDLDKVKDGIVFVLPDERMLESVAVWNYNKPAYTDMGIAKMGISVWTQKDGWKTVLKDAVLQEAEGTDDYDEPAEFIFKPISAEKVRFDNLTAFDPKAKQVGLSEVCFYEPLGPAACNPDPLDGSQAACYEVMPLLWTAGRDAVVHDVYVGETKETLQLLGRVKGLPEVRVSGLSLGSAYLWRVDEVAKDGAVETGPLWSFTTKGSLVNYWPLDETAQDIVGGRNGDIAGEPRWEDGHNGKALKFDGRSDYVEIPALNLNTNVMTITAWVKRNGNQNNAAPIFYTRGGNTPDAGLILTSDGKLWARWTDGPDWKSDLQTPDGSWAMVAYVVEPSKTTLYLHDGTTLHLESNTASYGPEEFDGTIYLGWDENFPGNRNFKGLIDEVQIFDFALSASQIEQLRQGQKFDLSSQDKIQLVDADLVGADQSLEEVAKEQQQPVEEKSSNLIAVLIVIAIVAGFAVFATLKKKK